MSAVLAMILYCVRWQRVMAWTTGIGLALAVLGAVLPPGLGFLLVMFGTVLAIGFPIAFAGVAFREIISNRRFAMVPKFRLAAAIGLLLLALAGGGAALIFANQTAPDISVSDSIRLLLLAFSAISAYLLLSQWLVIYSFGLIGFILLPLFVLRLWISTGPLAASALTMPWLPAAVASLGWAWLIVATLRPSAPKPVATPAWGGSTTPALQNGRGHHQWLPQWGRPASPPGTIMRGMPDGTRNRVALLVMAMLTFPVALWLVLYVLGAPFDGREQVGLSTGFFLSWSLIGLGMQASTVSREWPARLRYIWLRTGGDRNAGWRLMERSLLADIAIVAGLATLIALFSGLSTSTEIEYLGLYVAGCVAITWFASYAGFWTRASNWHELVHALIVLFVAFVCFGSIAFMGKSATSQMLYWLLPILGALTIVVRALAKHRFTRVDWCAARLRRKHT